MSDIVPTPLQPLQAQVTAIESMTHAEVDLQIKTAKTYPRNVPQFLAKSEAMIGSSPEIAEGCFYSLPRDGKNIQGGSIRLAELLATNYGNLRIGTRVIDVSDTHLTAQGVCQDLEANLVVTKEVRRRITGKTGRRYSDDMITTTSNAAQSIAMRNAVFSVVPGVFVKKMYEHAKQVAIGDAKTVAMRQQRALEAFRKMGVSEQQVCKAVNKESWDLITEDDLGTLIGYHTAIVDGDTTIDDVFPREPAAEKQKGAIEKPKSLDEVVAAGNVAKKRGRPRKDAVHPPPPPPPEPLQMASGWKEVTAPEGQRVPLSTPEPAPGPRSQPDGPDTPPETPQRLRDEIIEIYEMLTAPAQETLREAVGLPHISVIHEIGHTGRLKTIRDACLVAAGNQSNG